ncbi:MAG: hypothetical protein EPN86_04245 [Nanoarchaeota archaeon]|nr:MAG: hypothetical protein EPN86_04245 [Nanoarchaeota archaeon]
MDFYEHSFILSNEHNYKVLRIDMGWDIRSFKYLDKFQKRFLEIMKPFVPFAYENNQSTEQGNENGERVMLVEIQPKLTDVIIEGIIHGLLLLALLKYLLDWDI